MNDRLPAPRGGSPARGNSRNLPRGGVPPGAPRPVLSRTALRLLRFFLSMFFRLFRSSGAWKEAVARAADHPRLRHELGDPVEPGLWVGGRIQVGGGSGEAAFVVPLYGPRGDATLRVEARKQAGVWRFDRLEARVRGGPLIDLLAPPGTVPEHPVRELPGPEEM